MQKLSLFCQVEKENVISLHDVTSTYEVPLLMWEQNLDEKIAKRLKLKSVIDNKYIFLIQTKSFNFV